MLAVLIAALFVAGAVGVVTQGGDKTPTATPTITQTPTDSPTDLPTETPTETETPTTDPSLTGEPTDEPTDQPTDEPTTEPTDEPTVEPTNTELPPLPVSGTDDNPIPGLLLLGAAGIAAGALAGRRRVSAQSR